MHALNSEDTDEIRPGRISRLKSNRCMPIEYQLCDRLTHPGFKITSHKIMYISPQDTTAVTVFCLKIAKVKWSRYSRLFRERKLTPFRMKIYEPFRFYNIINIID